jgi:predicted negative regulator of RcsB-dependent stress response
MAYDHEEQEQLATLKMWWSRNGNLVTWALIAVLAIYAAWTGWTAYQRNQAAQAGQFYEEFQRAMTSQDKDKVQRAAADMQAKFPRSTYAEMTALAAAKVAFDANDLPAAKQQLQWIVDHGASDDYKAIARIRLAGVLLDEKAYDEGLKILSGDFPAQFASVVADRKGDIFVAQNKLDDARTAYQVALDKAEQKNPGRQLIQIKLDAIGGTVKQAA